MELRARDGLIDIGDGDVDEPVWRHALVALVGPQSCTPRPRPRPPACTSSTFRRRRSASRSPSSRTTTNRTDWRRAGQSSRARTSRNRRMRMCMGHGRDYTCEISQTRRARRSRRGRRTRRSLGESLSSTSGLTAKILFVRFVFLRVLRALRVERSCAMAVSVAVTVGSSPSPDTSLGRWSRRQPGAAAGHRTRPSCRRRSWIAWPDRRGRDRRRFVATNRDPELRHCVAGLNAQRVDRTARVRCHLHERHPDRFGGRRFSRGDRQRRRQRRRRRIRVTRHAQGAISRKKARLLMRVIETLT